MIRCRPSRRAFLTSLAGGLITLRGSLPGQPAAAEATPRVFCLSREGWREAKRRIGRDDPLLRPALQRLLAEADQALDVGPFSVVLKRATPPSGNKHDYMSLAPYAWPDPDRPDGRPYKGRDGYTNPEWWQDYDRVPLERLTHAAEVLALAASFTGRSIYAERAAHLLRVWFLAPATAMTPDLQFAQATPGRNTGRAHAIDTRFMSRLVDVAGLLAGSAAWTDRDQGGLVDWFRQFTANQRRRMDEGYRDAPHNIATYYHVQIAAQALFVGDTALAREMVTRTKTRLEHAVGTDGFFMVERNRTRSLSYSAFHAYALFNLATMGRLVGIDLWKFSTAEGRGLRKALDVLARHAGSYPPSSWPFPETGRTPGDWWDPYHDQLPVVLHHAANVYEETHYERQAGKILAARGGVELNYLHLLCGLPLIGEQAIQGWLFRPSAAGRSQSDDLRP